LGQETYHPFITETFLIKQNYCSI